MNIYTVCELHEEKYMGGKMQNPNDNIMINDDKSLAEDK